MAVALAQTVRQNDHSGSGTTVTLTITLTAGSLLVVGACLQDTGAGNPTSSGVTAGGVSMTQDITRQNASTDSRSYIFSLPNVAGGSTSVVLTRSSAAVNLVMYALEITGAATSSPQDGAGASATTTGANPASGNFTASVTDGAWVALFHNENGGTDSTVAAGSGWTMDTTNGRYTTGGTGEGVSGIETRMNPGSVGAFNGDFVAASAAYEALVFVYKAAGGGGGAFNAVPQMTQYRRRMINGV